VTLGRIIRRLLFDVGLALGALAVLTLVFVLSIRTGISVPRQWVLLTIWTLLVFWVIVIRRRERWTRSTFWLAVVGLLAGHLLVFVTILKNYPQTRPVWFACVAVVEAGILGAFLDALDVRTVGNAQK
jgi:hypothetical protein